MKKTQEQKQNKVSNDAQVKAYLEKMRLLHPAIVLKKYDSEITYYDTILSVFKDLKRVFFSIYTRCKGVGGSTEQVEIDFSEISKINSAFKDIYDIDGLEFDEKQKQDYEKIKDMPDVGLLYKYLVELCKNTNQEFSAFRKLLDTNHITYKYYDDMDYD